MHLTHGSDSAPGAGRPVTLGDVARHAGVSTATASRVLNGRPRISDATRQRVEAAIAKLGYVPSTGPRIAWTLRSISVVVSTLSDLFVTRVLEGVVAAAGEQDVDVLIEVLGARKSDGATTEAWFDRLQASGCVGVILVTSALTAEHRRTLRHAGLPVVHIDPVNPNNEGVFSVAATNFHGGVQATEHLIGLGHTRIAFAGGEGGSMAVRERLQGFISTMRTYAIPADRAMIHTLTHRYVAGVEMAERFLAHDEPPTAIFASSDAIALGVLEGARRRGLRVPQDISVVGFDDTDAATSSAPALTTIRQPMIEMGRLAVRTVIARARGEEAEFHYVQLATKLVVRESTAPPVPGA